MFNLNRILTINLVCKKGKKKALRMDLTKLGIIHGTDVKNRPVQIIKKLA